MGGLITVTILLLIGLIFGRINEANHFKRLALAEAELSDIAAYNLKTLPPSLMDDGVLVTGNVVIAVDYFKKIAAGIKGLFGGHIRSYESLVERARREAIVRMKQEAKAAGANAVYNVRLEFSTMGEQSKHAFGGVELLAYGTAVRRA